MPSRLEGIETPYHFSLPFLFINGSHVPSRLEGIETLTHYFEGLVLRKSSHVPSRLEGIETLRLLTNFRYALPFTCAFPFGGN